MPKFQEGLRVRVPKYNAHAPIHLYGRVGTITSVGPPIKMWDMGYPKQPVEQQYFVSFHGDGNKEIVWESWLEPV